MHDNCVCKESLSRLKNDISSRKFTFQWAEIKPGLYNMVVTTVRLEACIMLLSPSLFLFLSFLLLCYCDIWFKVALKKKLLPKDSANDVRKVKMSLSNPCVLVSVPLPTFSSLSKWQNQGRVYLATHTEYYNCLDFFSLQYFTWMRKCFYSFTLTCRIKRWQMSVIVGNRFTLPFCQYHLPAFYPGHFFSPLGANEKTLLQVQLCL